MNKDKPKDLKLLTSWEHWAVASKLVTDLGDNAPAHAAERIDAMEKAGARSGASNWRIIAGHIDAIRTGGEPN